MNDFSIVGTISSIDTLRDLIAHPEKLDGCDIIELRYDEYMEMKETKKLAKQAAELRPILITIRTSNEGGTWKIDDAHRFDLFKEFFEIATYADIELKSALFKYQKRSDFPADMQVITSFHDYKKCPSQEVLNQLIQDGVTWGSDMVKLAIFCNEASDRDTLEKTLKSHQVPLALMGMGVEGLETRLSLPPLGSKLTYGYLDKPAAPGQPSCKALAQRLR